MSGRAHLLVSRTALRVAAPLVAALLVAGCGLMGSGGTVSEGGDPVRRIAVLPAVHTAVDGPIDCALCSQPMEGTATSAEAADLLTAFFYEELARHPRFQVMDYRAVEAVRFPAQADTAAALEAAHNVDALLVPVLLRARQRGGSAVAPTGPAAVTVYASLLEAGSGRVLWSGHFEQEEAADGRWIGRIGTVLSGEGQRWLTAGQFASQAVSTLVEDLTDTLR